MHIGPMKAVCGCQNALSSAPPQLILPPTLCFPPPPPPCQKQITIPTATFPSSMPKN